MSFLTVGGFSAVSAVVTMPLTGLWRVDADLDADELPSGIALVEAPGLSLVGAFVKSGEFAGRYRVTVEPGAGRLAQPVAARFFRNATYQQIVAETLREAGESLAPSPLSGVASHWVRESGPASATVKLVASALGLTWGATDEGLLRLFSPTWDDISIDSAEAIDRDDTSGLLNLGTVDLSARPGFRIEGKQAVAIRHHVSDTVRTEVIF